jgi:hypothetical protein
MLSCFHAFNVAFPAKAHLIFLVKVTLNPIAMVAGQEALLIVGHIP